MHEKSLRARQARPPTARPPLPPIPEPPSRAAQIADAYLAETAEAAVPRGARTAPAPRPKDIHDLLDLPPRPLDVPRVHRPITRPAGAARTALVFGDTHVPYQDPGALAIIEALLIDTEPDVVIHLGDLLDCYGISRFSKDPTRLTSLQDEIDQARILLAQWRDAAPQAQMFLLEGNHEDRLRKVIWDLPGGAAELSRLTSFRTALAWPTLLGLGEMGWSWVPTGEQTKRRLLPKLITKHGTVVRKWSGWSGKGEWERYGRGGLSGHVHRLGAFYHRDFNGTQSWHEVGCTCLLDPEYVTDPDWQHGAAVVTYTDEWYSVELVYMQDGRARWRDHQYLV